MAQPVPAFWMLCLLNLLGLNKLCFLSAQIHCNSESLDAFTDNIADTTKTSFNRANLCEFNALL